MSAQSSDTLRVVRAFDRSVLREVEKDDKDALEKKLCAAVSARAAETLAPHARIAILERLARAILAEEANLTQLIIDEGGKPREDAAIEVRRAADSVATAAATLRTFHGREIPMELTPASRGRLAFTTHEPIGIVAALSAFNHPLNLIAHQVAPAVATGCPVIVKPAAATPLSCLAFTRLLHEAGCPEALCQTFITDDNQLAEALATDARLGFLSFIGSAKVGWYLRSKIAPGVRCALEHGGCAPVLVDKDVDIEAVVSSVVKGGYYHAGQVCVSTQRIFVHRAIFTSFCTALKARVVSLKTGEPNLATTQVGPLIHPREATRVSAWLDEARALGATLTGGERMSDTTLTPAVLESPHADAKVSTLEIFGPVTCVYAYDDVAQAIARANSLPYAFQASVFSPYVKMAIDVATRLDASSVMVNDHSAFRTDWMPFAGRKHSGLGVGGIPYTMHELAHEKMIVLPR